MAVVGSSRIGDWMQLMQSSLEPLLTGSEGVWADQTVKRMFNGVGMDSLVYILFTRLVSRGKVAQG